jgi:DNA-binding NarL/FixJ family response regulator
MQLVSVPIFSFFPMRQLTLSSLPSFLSSAQVVTQRMLSKLGYTAEFYGSGDALLASLENRVFDVILLDLKMPGCDGFECARRYVAQTKRKERRERGREERREGHS